MHPIISDVIDNLESRGALKPMPGSDHPAVRFFYPEAPCPGTEPLRRFDSVMDQFMLAGLTGEDLQAFFDWQHRFYSRGLHLYIPHAPFLAWLEEHLPSVIAQPLPPSFRVLVGSQISNLWHVAKNAPAERDRDALPAMPGSSAYHKEIPAVAQLARDVFNDKPEILDTLVVFQGMQLQFLEDLQQGVNERSTLPETAKETYFDAIRGLASAFFTSAFRRPAIWTAFHFDTRVEGDWRQPVEADDFAAGWGAVVRSGFSSIVEAHDGSYVETTCPYGPRGKMTVRKPLLWANAGNELASACPHNAVPEAQGLWNIHQALRQSVGTPHAKDLEAIRYGCSHPLKDIEGHPYFTTLATRNLAAFLRRIESLRGKKSSEVILG